MIDYSVDEHEPFAVALLRSLADVREAAGLTGAEGIRAVADDIERRQREIGVQPLPLPWFDHVQYQFNAGDTLLHWAQRKLFRLLGRESGVLWQDSSDLHPPRNLTRFAKSCLVPGGWRVAYVLKGQS